LINYPRLNSCWLLRWERSSTYLSGGACGETTAPNSCLSV